MTYRYNRGYRYRLTNPPKALLKARLDNIAIVPASMLPLTQTLKEKVNTLPKGGVFLCYAQENSRQRKILERVEEMFRQQGHVVRSMSMREVYKTPPHFELLHMGVVKAPVGNRRMGRGAPQGCSRGEGLGKGDLRRRGGGPTLYSVRSGSSRFVPQAPRG